MSELSELRADVQRLRTLTTKKISRIRRTHGAELSGTEFDPRRAPGIEKRYTKKQLTAYRNELQGLLNRKTQYVGLGGGQPLRRERFQAYKRVEDQLRERATKRFSGVRELANPENVSIADAMFTTMPSLHRPYYDHRVNSEHPATIPNRDPEGFTSVKKFEDLFLNLQRKLSGGYQAEFLEEGKGQFREMAEYVGQPELMDRINELTDEQWATLWEYGGVANDMSLAYHMQKVMNSREEEGMPVEAFFMNRYEVAMGRVNQYLDWAANLKLDGTDKKARIYRSPF